MPIADTKQIMILGKKSWNDFHVKWNNRIPYALVELPDRDLLATLLCTTFSYLKWPHLQ